MLRKGACISDYFQESRTFGLNATNLYIVRKKEYSLFNPGSTACYNTASFSGVNMETGDCKNKLYKHNLSSLSNAAFGWIELGRP